MNRKLGFIGLGRMGQNIVTHAVEKGLDVVVYNRTKDVTVGFEQALAAESYSGSLLAAYDFASLMAQLPSPRIVWLMIPNGTPIDDMLGALLSAGLSHGDTVIDGGNTYYKDSVRRAKELADKGITYIDCGTSGGLSGARTGACLMLGGDMTAVNNLTWLWEALAAKNGWGYMGPSGAGHFVKMVHNGIEYGMNQALGEGLEILSKGPYTLDYAKVTDVWSHGSVIRGWLVELLARAFKGDPKLDAYSGKVGGGQTGTWTLEAAKEFGVEAEAIEASIAARDRSQTNPTFSGKVVSALRTGYGGHKEPK